MSKTPDFHGHLNDDGTMTLSPESDQAKSLVGTRSITVPQPVGQKIEEGIQDAGLSVQNN